MVDGFLYLTGMVKDRKIDVSQEPSEQRPHNDIYISVM